MITDSVPNNNRASELICPEADQEALLAMINRHYSAHPWIPLGTVFRTTDQISRDSVREVYEFCESGNLIDL